MSNRNSLARSKVDEFSAWLIAQGITLLEPKGWSEVMRWKSVKGTPMAIVFTRGNHESAHLTLNYSAEPYFKQWLRERDQ